MQSDQQRAGENQMRECESIYLFQQQQLHISVFQAPQKCNSSFLAILMQVNGLSLCLVACPF
jgi:murein L,D-transpeptidase YafK